MGTVRLTPGGARRRAAAAGRGPTEGGCGHPWVYRTEVAAAEGAEPGDIVTVVDARGRFVGRGLYNPRSMLTVRLCTFRDEPVDQAFFLRQVERALDLRRAALGGVEGVRLVFAEADGLPGFIVDRFGPVVAYQSLSLGLEPHVPAMLDVIRPAVGAEAVVERNDTPVRDLEGLPRRAGVVAGRLPDPVVFRENGFEILVDVLGGQKTGYFLDQRENRAALHRYAAGRRVCDAFAYTGSFAVHALGFGASHALAVEASADAARWIPKNAEKNGVAGRLEVRVENAFDALRALDRAGERFGMVILDPPAFAKNRAALPGALRGYKEINLRALRILEPGGIVVSCSCSSPLEPDAFLAMLADAARDARRRLRLLEVRGQPPDHPILVGYPESRYLKCAIAVVD